MAVVVAGEEGAGSPVASPGLVRTQSGLLPWLHSLASGLARAVAPQGASCCPAYPAVGALDLQLWMLAAGAGFQQPPSLPQLLLSPAHASYCSFCVGHGPSHLNFFFLFFFFVLLKNYLFYLF